MSNSDILLMILIGMVLISMLMIRTLINKVESARALEARVTLLEREFEVFKKYFETTILNLEKSRTEIMGALGKIDGLLSSYIKRLKNDRDT